MKLFAPAVVDPFESIGQLLLALGLVNLVVVLAINPWRADRVPERFPNIVQDALVIGVFLVIATVVMEEKFLTTSAVGAVVIGFALQDTLGNTFAGLALQVEKPFRVGDWIRVASLEGQVREITWRATSAAHQERRLDHGSRTTSSRRRPSSTSRSPRRAPGCRWKSAISYDEPPNNVKAVILEALRDAPLVLRDAAARGRRLRVRRLVDQLPGEVLGCRLPRWTTSPATRCGRGIYYALRRAGIEIPYPIQVEYQRPWEPSPLVSQSRREDAVARVDIFAPLARRTRMAGSRRASAERLFGSAETVVREGEPGRVDVRRRPRARARDRRAIAGTRWPRSARAATSARCRC